METPATAASATTPVVAAAAAADPAAPPDQPPKPRKQRRLAEKPVAFDRTDAYAPVGGAVSDDDDEDDGYTTSSSQKAEAKAANYRHGPPYAPKRRVKRHAPQQKQPDAPLPVTAGTAAVCNEHTAACTAADHAHTPGSGPPAAADLVGAALDAITPLEVKKSRKVVRIRSRSRSTTPPAPAAAAAAPAAAAAATATEPVVVAEAKLSRYAAAVTDAKLSRHSAAVAAVMAVLNAQHTAAIGLADDEDAAAAADDDDKDDSAHA